MTHQRGAARDGTSPPAPQGAVAESDSGSWLSPDIAHVGDGEKDYKRLAKNGGKKTAACGKRSVDRDMAGMAFT